MKGSRAVSTPSGPPEGNPEGVDLSLTGLPPPLFRRPNSASAAKPIARSVSVVAGSEPRRKALVSVGAPGRGVSGPPTSWGVAGRVASDSWVSAAPRQAPHSCHPAQPCGPVQPCGCPEVRKDRELTHRRAGQSLDPPASRPLSCLLHHGSHWSGSRMGWPVGEGRAPGGPGGTGRRQLWAAVPRLPGQWTALRTHSFCCSSWPGLTRCLSDPPPAGGEGLPPPSRKGRPVEAEDAQAAAAVALLAIPTSFRHVRSAGRGLVPCECPRSGLSSLCRRPRGPGAPGPSTTFEDPTAPHRSTSLRPARRGPAPSGNPRPSLGTPASSGLPLSALRASPVWPLARWAVGPKV